MKGKLLKKPKFYIYKIYFVTGETYVGSHVEYKENDNYICSSIYWKRHPELKLKERKILFYLPTLEQMNIMESICIISDKCNSPKNINGNYGNWIHGFHSKLDCPWNKGLKMNDEFKNKISESSKETIICIETGKIINKVSDIPHGSEILNGIRKTYKGKHYRRYFKEETTEETKSLNKSFLVELYKEKKFYYCSEYNIAWESLDMLSSMLGTNSKILKENLSFRDLTIASVYIDYLIENNIPIIWKLSPPEWNSKKIKCIETNEIFSSLKDAEEKYKVSHIGDAANGNRKTAGGLHWKYIS